MNWALDLLQKMSARRAEQGEAAEPDMMEGEPRILKLAEHALRTVDDPELGINIVDLGLLYGLRASPRLVEVEIGLTSPSCPLPEHIARMARAAIKGALGEDISVDVTINRKRRWSPDRVSPEARRLLGLA